MRRVNGSRILRNRREKLDGNEPVFSVQVVAATSTCPLINSFIRLERRPPPSLLLFHDDGRRKGRNVSI